MEPLVDRVRNRVAHEKVVILLAKEPKMGRHFLETYKLKDIPIVSSTAEFEKFKHFSNLFIFELQIPGKIRHSNYMELKKYIKESLKLGILSITMP
jgi:hypothetical protein